MILTPQSQLLERNIQLFDEGKWLFINPSDAYFFDSLKQKNIDIMHQYYDVFSECVRVMPCAEFDSRDITKDGFNITQKVGLHTHTFTPFIATEADYTDVMIYLPKSKTHFQMLLRMAAGIVQKGARLHVVGENKGGIKSAAKLMQQYGATQKIDSARHCSIITTIVEQAHLPFEADAWFESDDYTLGEQTWTVCSMPGVFSHGALDKGTALLLEKLQSGLSGSVMDFACGAGVIASFLLQQNPHVKMILTDVSALAVYCSAMTLAANHQQAKLIAANGLHGVEERVNYIVTNPPFHTGIKTDYTITKRFIEDARRLLNNNGHLQMVANRFLPYPGLLGEHFPRVFTTAQTTQFSVYHAALQ
ncbi:methyltransferase [Alteromonas sp. A079]|uniref:methyltransferase n=1 Tax=Alteromonas sp. A079 TaxID=3410268 RepID=UPI00233C9DE8|nr:methyltransferase [Alteromonas sp.]